MSDLTAVDPGRPSRRLKQAVHQHAALSRAGMSERLFTWMFSGLVYAQIWEDPEVDMRAMDLADGHRVVAIASGGCNVLAYLTRSPALIDAVDLNPAHVALNRLKLAAARHLPSHADFFRFFGAAGNRHNAAAYDRFVAPHLDAETRNYWGHRSWNGRRRIDSFARDFYRTGLLGWFISTGHFAARLHGVDPRRMAEAKTVAEQRRFFEERLAPILDRPAMRWATARKASLFGLGIPPAQYDSLVGCGGSMAAVLRSRLEKLACGFPLKDNYFAWQAFARRYPTAEEGVLPPYLDEANFRTIRANAGRVAVHNINVAELLAGKPAGSVDRFVLLDAQDWMTDRQLDQLWAEITRTAASGARVIFRTAAEPSILEGRISSAILDQWRYDAAGSEAFGRADRSAIYGGFHLYTLRR